MCVTRDTPRVPELPARCLRAESPCPPLNVQERRSPRTRSSNGGTWCECARGELRFTLLEIVTRTKTDFTPSKRIVHRANTNRSCPISPPVGVPRRRTPRGAPVSAGTTARRSQGGREVLAGQLVDVGAQDANAVAVELSPGQRRDGTHLTRRSTVGGGGVCHG